MPSPLPLPGPIVDAAWLAARPDGVIVVDVRWYLDGRSGRAAYEAAHIPGAVFVDLDADLAAPPSPTAGRHPLPDPAAFAAAMGRLGIAEGVPVVAYDDAGGSVAARLWWLLHVLGQPVAVLDGGLSAWVEREGAAGLTTTTSPPVAVGRAVRPWPVERFVSADALADPGGGTMPGPVVVLDARTTARYEQGDPAIDPRPGHIPGARSAPWAGNLDPATGRFLTTDRLQDRYGDLRTTTAGTVVAYCGSGVTACHDLLALALVGVHTTALFPGSWSAWGADPSRPVETGPDPAPPRFEIIEDGDTTWRFDTAFLTSSWTCIWGRGCLGILDQPAEHLQQGCCSLGAELDDEEAPNIAALAAFLEPAQFQFHDEARRGGVFRDDRRSATRVVDGACIFLNRPGFTGGAGCALHIAAEQDGESPLDWKPSVCWQLPVHVDWEAGEDDTEIATVRGWSRADWGATGTTMAWCCTEGDRAYVGDRPVVESLGEELEAIVGEDVYIEIRRRLSPADAPPDSSGPG